MDNPRPVQRDFDFNIMTSLTLYLPIFTFIINYIILFGFTNPNMDYFCGISDFSRFFPTSRIFMASSGIQIFCCFIVYFFHNIIFRLIEKAGVVSIMRRRCLIMRTICWITLFIWGFGGMVMSISHSAKDYNVHFMGLLLFFYGSFFYFLCRDVYILKNLKIETGSLSLCLTCSIPFLSFISLFLLYFVETNTAKTIGNFFADFVYLEIYFKFWYSKNDIPPFLIRIKDQSKKKAYLIDSFQTLF